MPHHIQLTTTHQIALILTLDQSLMYKENIIRDFDKYQETEKQYQDAMRKIGDNNIKCGRTDSNLFVWLSDQIDHSGAFAQTEMAQYAQLICKAAAKNLYSQFNENTIKDIYNDNP